MQLSKLIPEPFGQLLVHRAELKRLLAIHDRADKKVEEAATKAFYCEVHCLCAIVSSCFLFGTYRFNPHVSLGLVSVIALRGILDTARKLKTAPAEWAAISLISGIAAIALLIQATTSPVFLKIGLAAGATHFLSGRLYRHTFSYALPSRPIPSKSIDWVISWTI